MEFQGIDLVLDTIDNTRPSAIEEDHLWLAILQDILYLDVLEHGVDYVDGHAGLDDTEVADDQLGQTGKEKRDNVPLSESQSKQPVRHSIDAPVQFSVGYLSILEDDGNLIRVFFDPILDDGGRIHHLNPTETLLTTMEVTIAYGEDKIHPLWSLTEPLGVSILGIRIQVRRSVLARG